MLPRLYNPLQRQNGARAGRLNEHNVKTINKFYAGSSQTRWKY